MQRVATTAARVARVASQSARKQVRRAHDHAHDDHGHHDHRVFEGPFEPMGAPARITAFCVVGGLGVVYTAYKLQMNRFTGGK